MAEMKLTPYSLEIFNYVKGQDSKVSVEEISNAVGRAPRSINANITDLSKKGLVERQKETVEEKAVTYVVLTEAGKAFTQPTE